MMNVGRRSLLIASAETLLGGALLSGCSTRDELRVLEVANTLLPGDGGVRRVAAAQPFGPDPRQKLDVYMPKRLTGPAPVVLFSYGGNWTFGNREGYAFVGEAFGSRGFVTIVADYRLVPAFRYPAFVQDTALAARWIVDNIARYGGDPQRLGLCGHSAGAYNVAMVAFDEHWLRDVRVDPAVVRALATLAGPFDFYPFDSPISQAAFAGAPDPKATQPINFARRDAPPSFIAAGSNDQYVKPSNSIHMVQALQRAGAKAELKLYPGLGHTDMVLALSKPFRRRAPVLEDVTAFLRTELA